MSELLPHPDKLRTLEEIQEIARASAGMVVALTFGTFDVPNHQYHLQYLASARALGDYLIVLLDSDEYTKRRKGNSRPNAEFSDRAEFLSWFQFVDYIVRHDGDNMAMIEAIQPSVVVASTSTNNKGDTIKDRQEEANYLEKNGGSFVVFGTEGNDKGISTSYYVKKIRNEI